MSTAWKSTTLEQIARGVGDIQAQLGQDVIDALSATSADGIAGALSGARERATALIALIDGALAYHSTVRS